MKNSLLFVKNKTGAGRPATTNFAVRLMLFCALLTFTSLAARAAVPVLTLPASVTVAEDGSTAIDIGVYDTAVPIFTVTTTATCTDTNLAPDADLVITGFGTNRLLTIHPGLHAYGTNTISVVATDSQPASTTNTFTLNVVFTNYPPVLLTSISDQTNNEDAAALVLPFTVYDIQTTASNMVYTLTSSNTTLIPNSNLVVSVIGTNCTLTVNQATNQNGTSLIQLVATDSGGDSVTNTFLMHVWAVNQPPTFTMATNTLLYNEYYGPVTFPNFITGVSSGPANQAGEGNSFTITYTGGGGFFAVPPALDNSGTLTFEVITNVFGTNTITFVLNTTGSTTNGGVNALTNTLTVEVASIIEPPSFTLASAVIAASEETKPVTNVNFVTSRANNGPTNANGQKWTYTITTVSGNAGEASFTTLALNTNGTLTFQPKAHSYGTNTVTVVMNILGTYTNGWIHSATNTFQIGVAAIAHAPTIVGATNRTILENSTSNLTANILLWDYDALPVNFTTNFNLTATSSSNSLVTVAVTTNAPVAGTNVSYTLTFGLTTNDSGTSVITLIGSEGNLSVTNTFNLAVTLINHAPSFALATNFLYATEESAKVSVTNFVTNFSKGPANQNSETFTYTVSTVSTNATNTSFTTLALATNGILTFQPKAHSFGTNTVTVVMTDSGGTANGGVASYTNNFDIGIDSTNHAPLIVGATNRTLLENSTSNLTATILLWDYDAPPTNFPTNMNLVATSLTNGIVTVAVTTNAVVNGTNASYTLTFGLTTNDSGTATIHLVANEGAYTTTTNFTVTVTLINHAPSFTLSATPVIASEESPKVNITNFVTSFNKGPTNQNNETFSYALTTVSTNATNASFTTLTLATNGILSFQPKAHSFGTNTVVVVMTDSGGIANGGTASATNSFQIAITATNHAPAIVGATNRTVLENSTSNLTATILLWDYDPKAANFPTNFNLTATSLTNSLVTVAVSTNAAVNGTNASFSLTFGLTTNDSGTAVIQLVASEGAYTTTSNFNFTVTLVNHAPTFTLASNTVQATEETPTVTVSNYVASFNKGPANQNSETFSYALTTVSTNSTNAAFTTLAINTAGTLTFLPKTHSYGTNLVTVIMTDSGGTANGGVASDTNTFLLEIAATNHAPVFVGATNRSFLENTNTGLTGTVLLWDYDAQPTNFPTNFNLTATSANPNLVTVAVTTNALVNGTNVSYTLTFGLATNGNGTASVQLVGTENGLTNTTNFTVTVTPVGKSPSFVLSTNFVATNEETSSVVQTGFVTGWTNTSSKLWKFTATTVTNLIGNATFAVWPVVTTNGTLTFSPTAHSYGTNAVTVVMTDNGTNSFTNAFQIGIARINHAPTIVATNDAAFENTTNVLTATVLLWNYDVIPANFPTNITLTATSLSNSLATVALAANAAYQATNASYTLTFTLVTNANGTVPVQLVGTENGLSSTNIIDLVITPVNQQPSFVRSTNVFVVQEETGPVTNVSFLTSISTGPANESSQTFGFALTTVTNGAGGTNAQFIQPPAIDTNGTLTFAPEAHSYGTNLVTIIMTDSGGTAFGGVNTATNTFLLEVAAINHAPTIVAATNQTVMENTNAGLTATVLLWDYDPAPTNFPTNITLSATSLSNSLVSVVVTTNAANQVTNASFTLTYTLVTNVNGTAPIQLIGTENGLSTTNIITLTIAPVNQAPGDALATNMLAILENAGAITSSNFVTNISVGPANQTGESYWFTVTTTTNGSPATNATFAVAPNVDTNGTLTFTTDTNSFGTNTITVVMTTTGSLTNGGVNAYTNSFQLQVAEVPYPPAFTGLTNRTLLENSVTNLTMAFTIYDPLTTNFTVSAVSSNTGLVNVSVSGTGVNQTLTFAPVTDQFGSTTVAVVADDGTLTNTNYLTLAITFVNQAPSFNVAIGSVTVDQYDVAVTVSNVVTNISAGPTNESGQTVSFIMTNSNSGLFLNPPSIDASGTLTFTPAATGGTVTVGIQAHDTGGTANGGTNNSPVQTMTIIIPPNAFKYLTGPFDGLFYPTNAPGIDNSGYFNLMLATNGTFTGYILCAGSSNTYSGQFTISNDTASVTAGGLNLSLLVDTSANWTETVSGSVINTNTNSPWTAVLESYLAGYSASFPATGLAGTYLMSVPGFSDPTEGPAGFGTFGLTISNGGVVVLTGFTADDTNSSQLSQISLNGNYPLYLPLYSNGVDGSLIGWLNFTGALSNSVDTNSTLTWFADTNASVFYTNGFTNQVLPLVSLYNPNLAAALSFSAGTVILTGGNLAAPITNTVTIDNNAITVNVADTNGLNLTINRSTGEVLGSFIDPTSLNTNSIYSIILQNTTNVVNGYFLGTNEGGSMILYGN